MKLDFIIVFANVVALIFVLEVLSIEQPFPLTKRLNKPSIFSGDAVIGNPRFGPTKRSSIIVPPKGFRQLDYPQRSELNGKVLVVREVSNGESRERKTFYKRMAIDFTGKSNMNFNQNNKHRKRSIKTLDDSMLIDERNLPPPKKAAQTHAKAGSGHFLQPVKPALRSSQPKLKPFSPNSQIW